MNSFILVLLFICLVAAEKRQFITLNDIHLDQSFKEGAVKNCIAFTASKYPCCHSLSVGTGKVGKYGAPKCDTPQALLEDSFAKLAEMYPSPDFIIYTGDVPSHEILTETNSRIESAMKLLWEQFDAKWPNTSIIPNIGNHDIYPLYNFPADNSLDHMKVINGIWAKWVSEQEAQATVLKAAYYTKLIAPGLRIVSLNANFYASKNLLVDLANSADPLDQKSWAYTVMRNATKNNESVWILLHMPFGDSDLEDSFNIWYAEFTASFSKTIKAQFAGHTAKDELRLIRTQNNTLVGHMYVTPALSPYRHDVDYGMWPSARVWTYETTTGEIVDYTQLHVNWDNATNSEVINFVEGYSAKSTWGLSDLTTNSWNNALGPQSSNKTIVKYMHIREARPYAADNACDYSCYRTALCNINYGISALNKACLGSLASEQSEQTTTQSEDITSTVVGAGFSNNVAAFLTVLFAVLAAN